MGNKKVKYEYICPVCGNTALYCMKYNKPAKCKFCDSEYTKQERIKVRTDDKSRT